MTYRGDSPGKKLTRVRTWLTMMRLASLYGLRYQGALVLAGDGGDLAVLDGLGFPLSSIAACDVSGAALTKCAQKYPKVKTLLGEVGVESESAQFNMAHIDFCGGLSATNIKTIADVCWNLSSLPSLLAVTLLKGRENHGAKSRRALFGKVPRPVIRRHLAAARKREDPLGEYLLRSKEFDPRKVLKITEKAIRTNTEWPANSHIYTQKGTLNGEGKAFVRAVALGHCVECTADTRGAFPGDGPRLALSAMLGYHSRTKSAHGTPFCTAIYIVSTIEQEKKVRNLTLEHEVKMPFHVLGIQESLNLLPPTAAQMATILPPDKVARLFDVPASTVIAWKAHASRGTYKHKYKPLIRLERLADLPESDQDRAQTIPSHKIQVGDFL